MTIHAAPLTLVQELDELHDSYARAINIAMETDDTVAAQSLAADYDRDATQLVAEREGLTHLLPLRRQGHRGHQARPDSRLRRLVSRLAA